MIGKKFKNIHNDKIILIEKQVITDEGRRWWHGANIADKHDWQYYDNRDLEKHWLEIEEDDYPILTPEDFGDRPTGEEE
tara:strand:+ start:646 stop:882 length:237 start_codon:yes stop_codon:yes gene_type:complete